MGEKLAQSHSCVRTHADHRGTSADQAALNDSDEHWRDGKKVSYIIACSGGCTEGNIRTVVETKNLHCQRCGPRRTLLFIGTIADVKISIIQRLEIILALAVQPQ